MFLQTLKKAIGVKRIVKAEKVLDILNIPPLEVTLIRYRKHIIR